MLLDLFQDVVPDVREQAFTLLRTYFIDAMSLFDGSFQFQLAIDCLKSPKAQLSESGSLYMKFFHMYYLVNADINIIPLKLSDSNISNASDLFEFLLLQLQQSIKELKEIPLKSCYDNPSHSWILAVASCVENYRDSSKEDIFNLVSKVIKVCENVILHTLSSVFGAQQNGTDNWDNDVKLSADFEQITTRVKNLVISQSHTSKESNEVLLSADYDIVLSCFWLNLRRSALLLCKISLYAVHNTYSNEVTLLLQHIYNLLLKILTNCRHRGVIDSCYEAFQKVSQELLKSTISDYQNIPKKALKTILSSLKNYKESDVLGATITRQSAGIPLIVEAILVSNPEKSGNLLISTTIAELLSICEMPVHATSYNDANDLPQVHALFVLRHLFKNAKLSSSILKYSSRTFIICLQCLSSPVWVVRNGATYLFGNLVSRILGQKHIETDLNSYFQNSMTTSEYFSLYPDLYDIILDIVKSSILSQQGRIKYSIRPGLHSTLTMLSKLTYGSNSSKHDTETLTDNLMPLIGCHNLPIRRLACKVIVSINSKIEVVSHCKYLIHIIADDGR